MNIVFRVWKGLECCVRIKGGTNYPKETRISKLNYY